VRVGQERLAVAAQEDFVQARHLALPQERNTPLPLGLAAQPVQVQAPEVVQATIPYLALLPQLVVAVAEVMMAPQKLAVMVVLVVAVVD